MDRLFPPCDGRSLSVNRHITLSAEVARQIYSYGWRQEKKEGWHWKENIIYVGIDLHNETHTAVMLDLLEYRSWERLRLVINHRFRGQGKEGQPFCDRR